MPASPSPARGEGTIGSAEFFSDVSHLADEGGIARHIRLEAAGNMVVVSVTFTCDWPVRSLLLLPCSTIRNIAQKKLNKQRRAPPFLHLSIPDNLGAALCNPVG
jgi:hypothetical protein